MVELCKDRVTGLVDRDAVELQRSHCAKVCAPCTLSPCCAHPAIHLDCAKLVGRLPAVRRIAENAFICKPAKTILHVYMVKGPSLHHLRSRALAQVI